jgi:hypothetical protein
MIKTQKVFLVLQAMNKRQVRTNRPLKTKVHPIGPLYIKAWCKRFSIRDKWGSWGPAKNAQLGLLPPHLKYHNP